MATYPSGDFMTPTTHANFIPELWSMKTLDAVRKNLVLAKLVDDYTSELGAGKYGDTIHIPHVSNFTAATKTPGSALVYQASTESKTDILINTHKVSPFLVEDITAIQANQNLLAKYTDAAGYSIAKAIDDALAALYANATTTITCGTAITWAHLLTARKTLGNLEAPMNDRNIVLDSEGIDDLLALTEVKNRDYHAVASSADAGVAGKILLGMALHESNNMATAAGSGVTNHYGMIFQKGAIAIVMQSAPRVQTEYSLDLLAWKVAIDCIFGVKVVRPDWLINLFYTVPA